MREPIDPAEFDELVAEIVAYETPRLFAVVQVLGDCIDGRVAAWGMAFEDHAEIVGVGRQLRARLGAAEEALPLFRRGSDIRTRLVWVNEQR